MVYDARGPSSSAPMRLAKHHSILPHASHGNRWHSRSERRGLPRGGRQSREGLGTRRDVDGSTAAIADCTWSIGCGALMITPLGAPAFAAGGTGSQSSQGSIAAPAGFNPLTASASQLAEYGFPPRPTSPEAYLSWARAMKHAVHDVPPAGGYGTLEGTTSGQWGGYYETSSDNGDSTYDDANATLDVPSCSETTGFGRANRSLGRHGWSRR